MIHPRETCPLCCLSPGKVKGELPDGGRRQHRGQTSEDPQGGVDPGQPPVHQVLRPGEGPAAEEHMEEV